MKKLVSLMMLAAASVFAQAPIPLTIDSRSPTAPGIDPYQASRTQYRVTFMDGTNPVSLTSLAPWMSWSTNAYATGIATASYSIVSSASGIVDFTFSASALNPTSGPGRYLYEVGLRATAGITVYRQGVLTLRGSPYASGVPAATWTTNSVNWGLINWTGLPTTLAGYGIVDGVDLANLLAVSNQVVTAQADIDAHELLTGTNVHGLGSAARSNVSDFASAAQGALAATALQVEADTNAIAQLVTHAALSGTNAHGLGSASTASTDAFATAAQGLLADSALQSEADTNALARLATHSNTPAMTAHSGLGSAATNDVGYFATAAQGALADSALQSEADTNALAQLATHMSAQGNTNAGFEARIGSNETALTAQAGTNATLQAQITNNLALQAATNAGFNARIGSNESLLTAQGNTNAAFQALHTAQANTNTVLQAQITANTTGNVSLATYTAAMSAQGNTNAGFETRMTAVETGKMSLASQTATNAAFQALHTAQGNTNTAFQALHTAQGNTNTIFRNQLTAHANTNAGFETRIAARETFDASQINTNATFRGQITALVNTNVNFELRIQQGETAYGWGDHADAGYLSTTQNLFTALYVGNRSLVGTNMAGLTQGAYTGVVGGSVSYTGTTQLAAGQLYAWGYTKIGADGTATLSIASASLSRTAAGNVSNYFIFNGTDTNLIINLAGTATALCNVSNIYVRAITNGTMGVAGELGVGAGVTIGGERRTTWPSTAAIEGRTSVWEQAATDASAATNFLATNTLQSQITANATGKVSHVEHDAHTNLSLASGAHGGESDPVWAAASNLYATGTPVYVESDPVWSGVSGSVVYADDSDYTNAVALSGSALQPGADGTSTNLSGYNNDAGFLTNIDLPPYQAFTTNLVIGDGGTATVTYACGGLVSIEQTNSFTLTFDRSSYEEYTNGVNRVGVEIYVDTNFDILFDGDTINTNDFEVDASSDGWLSLFFRRTGTNLWEGRQ
jgi:hypothetical protein